MKKIDEFINESFFKNINVGEYARVEAQLVEWSKQKMFEHRRIEPGSWTINKDYTVDVDGDVFLNTLDFEKLPVKFGKVTHHFSVNGCKNLTSLDGVPKKVGGSFGVRNCGKKFTVEEIIKVCKVKKKAIFI